MSGEIFGPNGQLANPAIRKIQFGQVTFECALDPKHVPMFNQAGWDMVRNLKAAPAAMVGATTNGQKLNQLAHLVSGAADNIGTLMGWIGPLMQIQSAMAVVVDEQRDKIAALEDRIAELERRVLPKGEA